MLTKCKKFFFQNSPKDWMTYFNFSITGKCRRDNKLISFKHIMAVEHTLHKIGENADFHWPVFSRIRIKSMILSLYGRIRVCENLYSRIFYAVTLWLPQTETYLGLCQRSMTKYLAAIFIFFMTEVPSI